jgi:hypothetical protein
MDSLACGSGTSLFPTFVDNRTGQTGKDRNSAIRRCCPGPEQLGNDQFFMSLQKKKKKKRAWEYLLTSRFDQFTKDAGLP